MTTITLPRTDHAGATIEQPDASLTACDICVYAKEHGWWGNIAPARTHCRNCHRSWRSLKEAHCSRCCAHFVSPRAFDLHLTEEACLPPGDVVRRDGKPRLVERESPWGPLWAPAFYGQARRWEAFGGTEDDNTEDEAGDE